MKQKPDEAPPPEFDNVLRRMLSTPPQPKKASPKPAKKKTGK